MSTPHQSKNILVFSYKPFIRYQFKDIVQRTGSCVAFLRRSITDSRCKWMGTCAFVTLSCHVLQCNERCHIWFVIQKSCNVVQAITQNSYSSVLKQWCWWWQSVMILLFLSFLLWQIMMATMATTLIDDHEGDDDDDDANDDDDAFLLSLLWVTWKKSLLFRSNLQSTQSISDTWVTKNQKSPNIPKVKVARKHLLKL